MAVAMSAAFSRLAGRPSRRKEWIHISRDAEAMVIQVPTGTQDHYPAAFGGVNAIHLEPGGERREPLACDIEALERRIVLCYTGKPRRSGINNWEVFKRHIEGDQSVRRNLYQIAAIAREVRSAILRNDWDELGRMVRHEWEFRRRNLPTISTPIIDRIVAAARRNGAMGAKVCGAGGGGCVVIVTDPDARPRVERAVEAEGGTSLAQRIARSGVAVRVR
jgi:D-glycero-alpha-D-manno-heptose-7-phosphate kinase